MKNILTIIFTIGIIFHFVGQDTYPSNMKKKVSKKVTYFQMLNLDEKKIFLENIDSIFEPLKVHNHLIWPVTYFVFKAVLYCDSSTQQIMIQLIKNKFSDHLSGYEIHRNTFIEEYKNIEKFKPNEVIILLQLFDCISMCVKCHEGVEAFFCEPDFCSKQENNYRKRMIKIIYENEGK